jgi:hypothetical protein
VAATLEVFVKEFVSSCDVCARAKNPCHCIHGLLQPLPIPASPWFLISMDFIVDFPQSNSFDSILVVVDHLTKMAHFIPCNKSITSEKIVKLVIDRVFCYHGLLEDIVFYRGPQFAAKFWNSLNY